MRERHRTLSYKPLIAVGDALPTVAARTEAHICGLVAGSGTYHWELRRIPALELPGQAEGARECGNRFVGDEVATQPFRGNRMTELPCLQRAHHISQGASLQARFWLRGRPLLPCVR
eukprot:scaffold12235_cov117-Isochrysis_galbana.AAC.1